MAEIDLVRAQRELRALEQGHLDGLCGLYAIINAVRVAVYPELTLSNRASKRLFERGLILLERKKKVRHTIVNGIDHALWLVMCHAVVAEAEKLTGYRLVVRHLFNHERSWHTRDVIRGIVSSVRQNQPVIICLEGRLDHWSVVTQCTPTRFNLFDSAGYRWIFIASLTASDKRPGKAHLVKRDGIFVLINPAR